MPYVKRTVEAGRVVETRKMQLSRIKVMGVTSTRAQNRDKTSEAQALANERKSEERLRWKLNANFGYRDFHLVLHYSDKAQSLEKAMDDRLRFAALLRKECRKRGIELKYIACTETKRLTNIHHHIVLSKMDVGLLQEIWERVETTGNISFRPMDRRGNHTELAAYLIKESRSTMRRMVQLTGRRGKRFSCSQNLVMPVPKYERVPSSSWRREPKPRKGYALYRFKDGSTWQSGWSDVTGYPWQVYYEVRNEQGVRA